jgi:hypothetical protein
MVSLTSAMALCHHRVKPTPAGVVARLLESFFGNQGSSREASASASAEAETVVAIIVVAAAVAMAVGFSSFLPASTERHFRWIRDYILLPHFFSARIEQSYGFQWYP